jgi:hypothetical protein
MSYSRDAEEVTAEISSAGQCLCFELQEPSLYNDADHRILYAMGLFGKGSGLHTLFARVRSITQVYSIL